MRTNSSSAAGQAHRASPSNTSMLHRYALAAAVMLLVAAPAPAAQSGPAQHGLEPELSRRLDFGPPECPPGAPSRCGSSCQGVEEPLRHARLHTAEARVDAIDMQVKGRGLDFVWRRTYRSRARVSSTLGPGWDFSYNIYVRPVGSTMVVGSGDGRQDVYRPSGPDMWVCDELFQTLTRNPDGTLTMLFADNGRWVFRELDGSPAEGRIKSSIDRNGNQLTFAYGPGGRLTTIVDTLGRAYSIGYGPAGLITSLTDFTGRSVQYSHYLPNATDGAPGDLKSVRTPVVTGTSTGNDFPNGKTTVYTYSKGTGSPRLDHNLLTITDPRGITFLSNTYSTTTDPKDPAFDRLERQVLGDPGDIIDLHYALTERSPENNHADHVTVLNDRVGNVAEYYYDDLNRLVLVRRFTGRADPDSPTTTNSNRPTGKLRSTDPDYFDTRVSYNVDSLITRFVGPDGDELLNTYELDLDPDAERRERGNLRERKWLPGPLGASQPELVESFEYQSGLGACCGSDFVTSHTNVEGDVETFTYDSAGNRTSQTGFIPSVVHDWEYNGFGQLTAHVHPEDGNGYRRRDELTYYLAGPQKGYLQTKTVDVAGLALSNTREYNPRGELVRSVDRRGFDTLITLNQLDQPVVVLSRPVAQGGTRQRTEYHYDENDNVVRVDIENRDSTGALQPNAFLTTTYTYGTLDELLTEEREVDVGQSVTTETVYDANRLPTLLRKGEATNGNDPFNVVRQLYDERDLLWRVTVGEGSALASTIQFDYDGSGRESAVHEGIEDPNHGTVTTSYDGFGRVLDVTDPMGNVHGYDYDASGNIVFESFYGELLDVPGSASNVALVRRHKEYDALDRVTRRVEEHFDPVTQNVIGDGEVVTTFTWSDASTVLSTTDDIGHVRTFGYDTLQRRTSSTDGAGNSSALVLDENGNVIARTETEVSDGGGQPVVSTTINEFDGMNRVTALVSPAGNRTEFAYDSRDNLVETVDPRGNVTEMEYDGLDRMVLSRRLLTSSGTGGSAVVGAIETRTYWDDSSRLVAQEDGVGNNTSYEYDSLDRMLAQSNPDCTGLAYLRDVRGNVVQITDENGAVVGLGYDLARRPVSRSVLSVPAHIQASSAFETYDYDGMGRLVRAQDDDSDVVRSWDSLSTLYLEIQDGLPVVMEKDVYGAETSCIYPSGRTIERDYDAISRLDSILENGLVLAAYDYVGPMRVEARTHVKQSAQTTVQLQVAYDLDRRPSQMAYVRDPLGAALVVAGYDYAWDAKSNKVDQDALLPIVADDLMQYDSADRLVQLDRMDPQSGPQVMAWAWDEVMNRTSTTGGSDPGLYVLDGTLCEPADLQVNQYTTTPWGSRQYDAAGQLTEEIVSGNGTRTFQWDDKGQLVGFSDSSTGLELQFTYDALGRRTGKLVDDGMSQVGTTFVYKPADRNGAVSHLIEERDDMSNVVRSYVYGRGLDECLQVRISGVDHDLQSDDLGSVVSMTDPTGQIVARYTYDPFGQREASGPSSALNTIGMAGSYLDVESGLYLMRTRYLDPRAGRFISRDTLGTWGDPSSRGNALVYVGNNPNSWKDPLGTSREYGSETCDHSGEKIFFKIVDLEKCAVGEETLHEYACDSYDAGAAAESDTYIAYAYVATTYAGFGPTHDLMRYWFGLGSSLTSGEEFSIYQVFKQVNEEMEGTSKSGYRVDIECDKSSHIMCGSSGNAWTLPGFNIHLCPNFFTQTGSRRRAILYHEFTHNYAGTKDKGYYYGTNSAGLPIYSNGKGTVIKGTLTTDKLIKNADTYEEFLLDTSRFSGNSYITEYD